MGQIPPPHTHTRTHTHTHTHTHIRARTHTAHHTPHPFQPFRFFLLLVLRPRPGDIVETLGKVRSVPVPPIAGNDLVPKQPGSPGSPRSKSGSPLHSSSHHSVQGAAVDIDIETSHQPVAVTPFPVVLQPTTMHRSASIVCADGKTLEEKEAIALERTRKSIMNTGQVSVFLSSPFKGIEEERRVLARRELPRLQRMCEARGVHLRILDLRYGPCFFGVD
jgi:hypothetical protein